MKPGDREEELLQSVALQNATSILRARQRAEQDLSETQDALRQSNERLTRVLESITDGFLVVDSEWRFTYVNAQAVAILRPLDKTRESLLGRNLWQEFPALLDTEFERAHRRAAAEQVTVEMEAFYPPSGSWLVARVYPSPDGLSIYFQDISRRKDAEERLRATFEQAAVGMAIASLDGRFLEMNGKFCELLGYSGAELRELTFRDITHVDDLAATGESIRQLLAGEIRAYSLEKRYVRRDGSLLWSLATVTLLRDPAGRANRFIGVIEDISKRKETEESLRRSEQFSRSVIESSRDCLETLTLDGVLTWVSDPGGRSVVVGQAVGRSWIDSWLDEDREKARVAVGAAAAGGTGSFVGGFPVAGETRWWDVVVTPVRDREGRPDSLLVVSRDVTERMAAEANVRESERQLRHLADSIPQLAWMAESDGHIFWYNQGWYEYTGTTHAQMEGWGWQSVHDPEVLPAVLERWRGSIETGEPFEMEFPLRGADGVFRWFLTRVNPMRDGTGRVARWFGTNTDVDQVKRIRHTLEEETRILELLNRTGTSLASTLDLPSLLQSITDAATQLSGAQFGAFFHNVVDERGEAYMLYTLSGAPREAFEQFGHPRATPLFGPTFRAEGVIRCDDVLLDARYGRMEPHHGTPLGNLPVRSYLAVPVTSRSGEVIGGLFFGHAQPRIFTERTERLISGVAAQAGVAIDNARLYEAAQKAAAERELLLESERHARTEAERASRMKDEFLATLSHELRTPLTAILGWSHLLRAKPVTQAELHRALETIERNSRVQTQLIDDLLDMSRITSGKVRLDVQEVMPLSFMEAALETVRPAAEAKGIRLERTFDPAAGPVSGDPGRLQQVAWNLLNNAIKFTPKEGKVRVVLQRVDSHIEINVADTGVGIDPAFLTHVFERFRQADASTTRQFGGLGLGLSIVKHLVELHGGTVHASSGGTGTGSTFSVRLPLLAVQKSHEDGEPRLHPRKQFAEARDLRAIDLAGIKVLVVDDHADARELVARVLSECAAEVITASGAEEALQLIESERPHVLVSDIGMPDIDGFELLRRVRDLGADRGGSVAAIALTAFARSEDRTRALHRGFLAHLAKPVEPSELIATVASVAGRTGTAAG